MNPSAVPGQPSHQSAGICRRGVAYPADELIRPDQHKGAPVSLPRAAAGVANDSEGHGKVLCRPRNSLDIGRAGVTGDQRKAAPQRLEHVAAGRQHVGRKMVAGTGRE